MFIQKDFTNFASLFPMIYGGLHTIMWFGDRWMYLGIFNVTLALINVLVTMKHRESKFKNKIKIVALEGWKHDKQEQNIDISNIPISVQVKNLLHLHLV